MSHSPSFCCLQNISREIRLILRRLLLCRSTALSLCHSFPLSLLHSAALSLWRSSTLPLFPSVTLSLCRSFTPPLFHSITLSLFHCIALSLHPSFALSVRKCIAPCRTAAESGERKSGKCGAKSGKSEEQRLVSRERRSWKMEHRRCTTNDIR